MSGSFAAYQNRRGALSKNSFAVHDILSGLRKSEGEVSFWMSAADRFTSLAPDDLSRVASGAELKVDVLSAGGVSSRSRQIKYANGSALDLTELNAHVRASGGFDHDGIALISATRLSDATICGTPIEAATVLAIPGGVDITAAIRPGLRYAAALLPTGLWLEAQAVANGAVQPMPRAPVAIRLNAGRAQDLQASLGRLLDSVAATTPDDGQPPAALLEHVGLIAEASARAQPEAQLDRSFNRQVRQAWLAQDFIHAHLDEDLPVMRLCREVAVSRRQLEYAFRTTFGVAPRDFVQSVRLNEARRRLMRARGRGQTITDIALETGITHLGRFAHVYRRLFGESPRQTLAGGGATRPA